MKNSRSLTPSKLRILLSVTLILTALAGIGVFYFAYDRLSQSAEETGSQVATATESQYTLQRLQTLREELDSQRDTVLRASRIMADSQNYAYQDRLVSDLTEYARRANLTINNINFAAQTSSSAGTTAPPASGGDRETGEGGEAGGAAAAPAASLNKATVDITLQNPVNYSDLLNFLHYIEQNLTKLKVSKVSMTKSDADQVNIDVLNLEVHIR